MSHVTVKQPTRPSLRVVQAYLVISILRHADYCILNILYLLYSCHESLLQILMGIQPGVKLKIHLIQTECHRNRLGSVLRVSVLTCEQSYSCLVEFGQRSIKVERYQNERKLSKPIRADCNDTTLTTILNQYSIGTYFIASNK